MYSNGRLHLRLPFFGLFDRLLDFLFFSAPSRRPSAIRCITVSPSPVLLYIFFPALPAGISQFSQKSLDKSLTHCYNTKAV